MHTNTCIPMYTYLCCLLLVSISGSLQCSGHQFPTWPTLAPDVQSRTMIETRECRHTQTLTSPAEVHARTWCSILEENHVSTLYACIQSAYRVLKLCIHLFHCRHPFCHPTTHFRRVLPQQREQLNGTKEDTKCLHAQVQPSALVLEIESLTAYMLFLQSIHGLLTTPTSPCELLATKHTSLAL